MSVHQKILLLLSLSFGAHSAVATHIVGGGFEMLYQGFYTYRINMILYFDAKNGSESARDERAFVYIYRKRDRSLVEGFILPLGSEEKVEHQQPACSRSGIEIRQLIYTSTITLPTNVYNDAEGYYLVWQRCCRNFNINNIYSENNTNLDGSTNPSIPYAGQTFYLEFPPSFQNGKAYINSSPHLFPTPIDYVCPNQPYFANFSSVDDDGDSLAYSLATPLSTVTGETFPSPSPGPYPEVKWKPDYSLARITGGHPDMQISQDGFLRLTPPAVQGLFSFAVKVEEYRHKVKIGETRRDYQLYVVDKCSEASPPIIQGKKLYDANYSDEKTLDITFAANDQRRSLEVKLTDADSKRTSTNYSEHLTVTIKTLNFSNDRLSGMMMSPPLYYYQGEWRFAPLIISFPKCPFVANGPARLAIIVQDETCPAPLTDTLKVNVTVLSPEKELPMIYSDLSPDRQKREVEVSRPIGEPFSFVVTGAGPDNAASLTLSGQGEGFDWTTHRMYFSSATAQSSVNSTFQWTPECADLKAQDNYLLRFNVRDPTNKCPTAVAAPLVVKVKLFAPGKKETKLYFDNTQQVPFKDDAYELEYGTNANFTIRGKDENLKSENKVRITLADVIGDPKPKGFLFNDAVGQGEVSSLFTWATDCSVFKDAKSNLFDFVFKASTEGCLLPNTSDNTLKIRIMPPAEKETKLYFDNTNQVPFKDGAYELGYGTNANFTIRGKDENLKPENKVRIALADVIGDPKPKGFLFKDAVGQGEVSSLFTWATDCSVFKDAKSSNLFGFVFKASTEGCLLPYPSDDTLKIRIMPPAETEEFTPPNVITPDGDGCNDYFAVEDIPEAACGTRTLKINFPKDNCAHSFEYIKILNRYGKEVFDSHNRNFRWYAHESGSGIYYYLIKFSDTVFRGSVNVIR